MRGLIILAAFTANFAFQNPFNINEYFPLNYGAKWTYQQSRGDITDTVVVEIKGTKLVDTVLASVMSFSNGEELYFFSDTFGLFFYGLKNAQGVFLFDKPVGMGSTHALLGEEIKSQWYVNFEGSNLSLDWGTAICKVGSGGFSRPGLGGQTHNDVVFLTLDLAGKSQYQFFLQKGVGIIEYSSPSTFGTRKLITSSGQIAAERPTPKIAAIKQGIQNYPNPFRPSTTFLFPNPGKNAQIKILDATGRVVGFYHNYPSTILKWSGANLPSGAYLAEITVGHMVYTKPIILAK